MLYESDHLILQSSKPHIVHDCNQVRIINIITVDSNNNTYTSQDLCGVLISL